MLHSGSKHQSLRLLIFPQIILINQFLQFKRNKPFVKSRDHIAFSEAWIFQTVTVLIKFRRQQMCLDQPFF